MPPKSLEQLIQEARPDWSDREQAAVRAKLKNVNINTVKELEAALDRKAKRNVNVLLAEKGLKIFAGPTLRAFRRSAKGLPIVAQHCNVQVQGESLVSQSTHSGWGIVIFHAPEDFAVAVQLEKDAGKLAAPFRDYLLVGLVPSDVDAQAIAVADQPWDWGEFVAPCTSPVEVWSRTRHPKLPHKLPDLPKAVRAGQTLQLQRSVDGVTSVAVNDSAPTPLPAEDVFKRKAKVLRPCVLLGHNTRVKVWITLSRGGRGPKTKAAAEKAEEPPAKQDPVGGDADAVANEAPEAVQQQEHEGLAEQILPTDGETGEEKLKEDPGQTTEEVHAGPSASSGEAVQGDEKAAPQLLDDLSAASSDASDADQNGVGSPSQQKLQERRHEEVRKAKASKKYSVGELVGFFEPVTKTPESDASAARSQQA